MFRAFRMSLYGAALAGLGAVTAVAVQPVVAQEQGGSAAPAAGRDGTTTRLRGGGGCSLGRGGRGGPVLKRSALRAIPAETLAAKVADPNCITRGSGGILPLLYGNGLRIAQTPNDVVRS